MVDADGLVEAPEPGDAPIADAPDAVEPAAPADTPEAPTPVEASAAPAPEVDAETASLLGEIEKLGAGSVAEQEVAKHNLGLSGVDLRTVIEAVGAQRASQAGAPEQTDDEILASLNLHPDALSMVKAVAALTDRKLAPMRALVEQQAIRQRQADAKAADDAKVAEFESVVKETPVYRLMAAKSPATAEKFVRFARMEVQEQWADRVRATHDHFAAIGSPITIEQAQRMTPPPTKADFKAAAQSAQQPFAALVVNAKPAGRAPAPTPPPVGGPRGASSGIDNKKGPRGGDVTDEQLTTREGQAAAFAAVLDRASRRAE